MADNPFFVRPPNVLEALMAGAQGYDRARKSAKENQQELRRQSALQKMQAGDVQGAFAETLGGGDADSAKAIATYSENQANRAFRESEAARNEAQWRASHGLQQAQLGLQRATLEQGRLPAGYTRTPDGNLVAIPGGPADPAVLAKVTAAKKEPTDNFDPEQKLRKEFEGNAKPYLESRRGYERVLASKDDAAGDISLIFGYMKLLDPGSVVREGEFATAQNAAGIPDQIKNIYNRALEGTRLNPGQRKMFQGQAGALYKTARGEYDTRANQMRGIAQQYNLNADRIITPLGPVSAAPMAGNLPPPPPGFNLVQ